MSSPSEQLGVARSRCPPSARDRELVFLMARKPMGFKRPRYRRASAQGTAVGTSIGAAMSDLRTGHSVKLAANRPGPT